MILLIHILIAVSGIVLSTLALLKPTKLIINISMSFIALTLVSGTILGYAEHAKILSVCISGLLYTAVTGSLLAAASWRAKSV